MSSPDQDDSDKHTRAIFDERQDETRRFQQDVLESAQLLKRKSAEQPSQTRTAPPLQAVGLRLDDCETAEEMHRRVWTALQPELMPPPPRDRFFGPPGRGFLVGFFSAIALGAAVALVVVTVIWIPSIGGDASRENEVGRRQANAFGNLNRVTASPPKMRPAREPSVPPGALLAAAPSSSILQPKPPALQPPAPAALQTARPEMAVPTASRPPAPAASPEPRPSPSLSRDEAAALLKRGQDLIAAGDIATARLILAHVAEAGVAEASLAMAGTYDGAVLANVRVVGVRPDPAKARAWYERAAEQGSWEAKRRLSGLR
jgi:hypothetical protein